MYDSTTMCHDFQLFLFQFLPFFYSSFENLILAPFSNISPFYIKCQKSFFLLVEKIASSKTLHFPQSTYDSKSIHQFALFLWLALSLSLYFFFHCSENVIDLNRKLPVDNPKINSFLANRKTTTRWIRCGVLQPTVENNGQRKMEKECIDGNQMKQENYIFLISILTNYKTSTNRSAV